MMMPLKKTKGISLPIQVQIGNNAPKLFDNYVFSGYMDQPIRFH